jgi:23S rRNA pseudouridine1911/1915/1917 synthase
MNEKIKQLECSVFADSNIRLDRFLVNLTGKKRSYVSELISDGFVHINNATAKRSYKPKQFDLISIRVPLNTSKLVPREELISVTDDLIKTSQFIIPIVYHDDHIIVVNKPIGLLVHEAVSNQSDHLTRILEMASVSLFVNDDGRPGIVHRLDQFTEGLLVMAKSKLAFESLKKQFKNRDVKKKYYTVLKGVPTQKEGEINRPIGRDISVRARKSCINYVAGSEKSAITQFKLLEEFTNLSLVDVDLITGRTHQIRVHFAAMGCPVLGDSLYSKQTQKKEGYYLQSYFLGFIHPYTNKLTEFKLPISMRLKKYAKSGNYN